MTKATIYCLIHCANCVVLHYGAGCLHDGGILVCGLCVCIFVRTLHCGANYVYM